MYFYFRLEKIATYEAQRASGKVMDKEQLALLETKSSLEKSVYDLSSIKTQLEEVAKVGINDLYSRFFLTSSLSHFFRLKLKRLLKLPLLKLTQKQSNKLIKVRNLLSPKLKLNNKLTQLLILPP